MVAAGLAQGCSSHNRSVVYVPSGPPVAVKESTLNAPGPGYVWIPGYHLHRGGAYVWVPGHYELAPRSRTRWVAGHWNQSRHGWYWVEGYWR